MAAIKRGGNKVTPAFSMEGEGAGAFIPAAKTPTFPTAKRTIKQMVKTITFLEPSISFHFKNFNSHEKNKQ